MIAHVRSAALLGVDAFPVDVEVDISNGLPSFATVGLPLGAVKEGRERVHAALQNAGFMLPLKRITVNLAPADVRKDGSAFDLPIALAILAASGQLPAEALEGQLAVGEVGLHGDLRPVRGVLPIALAARGLGARGLVVPAGNVGEAAVVQGLAVRGARSLAELVAHFAGRAPIAPAEPPARPLADAPRDDVDFADVRGQLVARRALEIAAAGGHNVLLVGPPGSGKTMLARRLPTILPPLSLDEALEASRVHSVAGLLPAGASLVAARPFRAPHHTISDAGLIGGGRWPRPGEVSLAHHGVLFLDEFPEFRRHVLEALRQPMEDGHVSLSRAATSLTFPARFMLVAAMNPCPCGHRGDPVRACRCDPLAVARYRARLSGPLLDRIDLHVEVPALPAADFTAGGTGEASAALRARVMAARERQLARQADRPAAVANARLGPRDLRRWCTPDAAGEQLLRAAMTRLGLSARAAQRALKVARTIADLAGHAQVGAEHVAEAVQYRLLDRGAGGPGAAA